MTDKKTLFNLLAENSYYLHEIIEIAGYLNAGSDFTIKHDEKENFISFMKTQVEANATLIENLKNENE